MAGLVNAGRNLMLNGLTAGAAYASLHTADPGTNGTAEVTGGSYTREALSWAAAANGTAATNAQVVFDVPGGTTITHLGYWTAATSGTFLGSRPLDASQTYSTAGTYTIASGNIAESVS